MELKTASDGEIKYCPFHENEVPSSFVNRIGNFWHYFAGSGVGSIIDCYMKLKGIDIDGAVHDLKDLLEKE